MIRATLELLHPPHALWDRTQKAMVKSKAREHVVTSRENHTNFDLHHPAVKMFRVKGGDWGTDGRAINDEARYQVRFFFGRLAVEIADACKKIVHGYDNQLYKMAQKKFDQLAKNPRYDTRYDVHMRDYKSDPTPQPVVDTYDTGLKVAHYFLRVFRHNQHLKQILGKSATCLCMCVRSNTTWQCCKRNFEWRSICEETLNLIFLSPRCGRQRLWGRHERRMCIYMYIHMYTYT